MIKLKCNSLNFDGTGVVFNGDKLERVVNLLPGETAELETVRGKLKVGRITETSPMRITPKCPVFDKCGGCQFLHTEYESELQAKTEYMEKFFSKYNVDIHKVIKMSFPYNYRNKCQMAFKSNKKNQAITAFYEENSHRMVSVSECKLHNSLGNDIIKAVTKAINKNKIRVYNEEFKTGLLKHIVVRVGMYTNEAMVILVTKEKAFPGRNNLMKDVKKIPGITTVVQNVNSRDTSMVLGDFSQTIYGPGFIYDKLGKLKIKVGPNSFYQVNTKGMKILYDKVIELGKFKKTDVVLDTYCGIGTIGLYVAEKVNKVFGVEINKEAIKDANTNKRINGIKNVEFFNSDSTKFMETLDKSEKVDVVIMDPPRAGSTESFIKNIQTLRVPKVVYVSCDPFTLSRDLDIFVQSGYKVKNIESVDMFSRTANLETVVILVKE